MKIEEMPVADRPYEKCERFGAQVLSDAELLAVILRTGRAGESAVDIANRLLTHRGGGILNLYTMSRKELCKVPGIGRVKSLELKCIAELSKRIANARRREDMSLDRPETMADYYMEQLRHETREQLIAALLDAKMRLIADPVLAIGSYHEAASSPRDIFLEALEHGAVNFALIHNHPSGDPTPSEQDLLMTDRVRSLGEMMQIYLVDHIIIGDHRYYSFRQNRQL